MSKLPMAAALVCGLFASLPAHAAGQFTFSLQRNAVLPSTCAAGVKAAAKIQTLGFAERLVINIAGLKPGTGLDVFAIQVPAAPFGLAWYVGDLPADKFGSAFKAYISRFNIETFALALGAVPAPNTHPGLDAATNPVFQPVHTYHLGIWFNSPADAIANGCPATVTPFNGEHTAGVQALNTGGFPDLAGPLSKID